MTVTAIWCRHDGDNIIGIGSEVPWQVKSDKQRFWDVVDGKALVCGRKTYEGMSARLTAGRKMFVMTRRAEYQVSDSQNHVSISSQKPLAELEEDIYIAGGAEIYTLFMTGKEALKPHIVVDCVYHGQMGNCEGARIDITDSVLLLEKQYRRISPCYCLDNVSSSVWIRKGEFVNQSVLKKIISVLEQNAAVCWTL